MANIFEKADKNIQKISQTYQKTFQILQKAQSNILENLAKNLRKISQISYKKINNSEKLVKY